MRHSSATDKAVQKYIIDTASSIKNYEDSKPEHRDPKAYARFKAKPTYYGSDKKCSYGDKQRLCNPDCKFWRSCIKSDWKGENGCTV